jgi:RNA polymerase sigma-70 factor (ECF subfamily)
MAATSHRSKRRATRTPPSARAARLELSRVHSLRNAEIAQALGISVKTVEAQMGKALRTLRERLGPYLK